MKIFTLKVFIKDSDHLYCYILYRSDWYRPYHCITWDNFNNQQLHCTGSSVMGMKYLHAVKKLDKILIPFIYKKIKYQILAIIQQISCFPWIIAPVLWLPELKLNDPGTIGHLVRRNSAVNQTRLLSESEPAGWLAGSEFVDFRKIQN